MYAMYAVLTLGALVMILWLTAAWIAFTDEERYFPKESSLPDERKAA